MVPGLNRRILIVDDQEDLRQQVAKLLRQGSPGSETSSLIEQIRSRISKTRETPSARRQIVYEVDTVGQGKDAFNMVKESFGSNQPYALMFLDMRMPPGWDGLETAQRIRSIDKEIQIVIMTAYADYEQREIAERIGEPDKLIYLKKPFHPEEIRQLALAMTEKWNMNRREKERVILTNRLMRENSHLTKRAFKGLTETYRSVLDAFVFFLDARAGIFVRCHEDGREEVCGSTSPEDTEAILKALTEPQRSARRMYTSDNDGAALFPIAFRDFRGFIYIEGKNLVFSFEQLQPFLEILVETTHEVLKNAFLLQEQGEQRQFQAIGKAMAKLTGDVRQALDRILRDTKALRDAGDSGDRERLCNRVDRTAADVLALCEDIVQFAGDRGATLTCATVATRELLDRVMASFDSRVHGHGIAVSIDVAPETAVITCDADAVERGLWHLVDNAVTALAARPHADDGKPRKLGLVTRVDGDMAVVEVCDNGVGITEEVGEAIFKPFALSGGGGLGVVIAQRVAEKHGGSLTFESEFGKGTTFRVALPLKANDD